ncbi:MAG: hypothetical protein ACTHK4_05810, partial [Mycobacteriales bacterium]
FPKPTGASALPAQLALRLHTLGFNAKIFSRLRTAIQHGDVARIDRLLNQLDQVRATLIAFSGDLRRYGATSCALVIGQWAGKPIGPQGHRRSVST